MPNSQTVKIWDLPVRLLHWSMVICFMVSWATASWFDDTMQIHLYSGYTMLVLILFRIAWGFAGSSTARFSHFISGISTVKAYAGTLLQARPGHYSGHNPLGGWAVLTILSLLLFQTLTGLFANDDILTTGPLAHWVGKDLSDTISNIHSLAFDFLLGIIGLHIAAVLFYRFFKGDDLISAMFTGSKTLAAGNTPTTVLQIASNWRAMLLLILIAGGVIALVAYNT